MDDDLSDARYLAVASMLRGLATDLEDSSSRLRKQFVLSPEQFKAMVGIIRVACSPSIERLSLYDLSKRWHVSTKTIDNWVRLGIVRCGTKKVGEKAHYWISSEVDEDERELIKRGYLKQKPQSRLKRFADLINGLLK